MAKNDTDPKLLEACERFLKVWHERDRKAFDDAHEGRLNYDSYYPKSMAIRRKWICLDRGNENNRSGVFMVRKADGAIFTIEAYGRPNLRYRIGNVYDEKQVTK